MTILFRRKNLHKIKVITLFDGGLAYVNLIKLDFHVQVY